MTGCAGEYDVLDKVADSTTVGESITDKINDMVSDQSQNVTYICKRMKALSGETETEEDTERPEYNPETYADTSKADISISFYICHMGNAFIINGIGLIPIYTGFTHQ